METTRHARHRAVAGMLLTLPLLTAACATPSPQTHTVEIDCERFAATAGDSVRLTRWVAVQKGATIVLRLCSNPSTGFHWEEAIISTPEVLTERRHEYLPPATAMPGAAGLEQWSFLAVRPGTCTISLTYSRPWDEGDRGSREFELEVEVT